MGREDKLEPFLGKLPLILHKGCVGKLPQSNSPKVPGCQRPKKIPLCPVSHGKTIPNLILTIKN